MAFVPPPVASPRARELGRELADVIEKYRREHPDVSGREVRQALRIALRGGEARPQVALLAMGVAALLGLFASLYRNSGEGGGGLPILPFILLIVLLVGWVLFVRLR